MRKSVVVILVAMNLLAAILYYILAKSGDAQLTTENMLNAIFCVVVAVFVMVGDRYFTET